MWNRHGIHLNTKLRMYKAIVLTKLLYGGGDLDRLLEPNQESESLPWQLPPQNTESKLARQDPGHESPGADRNPQHPRHAEVSETVMERPPNVTTGARRKGGQKRRYRDTLKKYLKELQLNPVTWVNLTLDRPAWIRSVKTGAEIYEANRIAAAKAKTGGSQVTSTADQRRQCPSPANVLTLSTHIPRANQPVRTSSNSMQQQSHYMNLCHTCLRPHDHDHPNHC
ncbi:unnamed protein product [Schistocephalus solidus]|uniref:Uncharacterized protein n=1 Tax=Schistocephalus solidus TaxID=70667 RepID=A0A183SIT4_SCHSO|nr:unnamed protein product [Schistocephalus solidus]